MERKGRLLILSAPSGCGKTTIVEKLRERNPNIVRSVSVTTRKRREGEVDGKDYFFVSTADFFKMRGKKRFLEWAKVFNKYYGTPRDWVEEKLSQGLDVILVIEPKGARQIRRKTEAISIFIMPPSREELEERLKSRGSDSEREMRKRLKEARAEMDRKDEYNYVVVNENIDDTVREIESILSKEDR